MKKLLDTNNIVYTTVPIFIILMLTNNIYYFNVNKYKF